MPATEKLSPLAFGNRCAVVDTSINSLCDTVGRAIPGQFDISSISEDKSCSQKSSVISLGKISLAAASLTPALVKRDAIPSDFLMRIGTICLFQE